MEVGGVVGHKADANDDIEVSKQRVEKLGCDLVLVRFKDGHQCGLDVRVVGCAQHVGGKVDLVLVLEEEVVQLEKAIIAEKRKKRRAGHVGIFHHRITVVQVDDGPPQSRARDGEDEQNPVVVGTRLVDRQSGER